MNFEDFSSIKNSEKIVQFSKFQYYLTENLLDENFLDTINFEDFSLPLLAQDISYNYNIRPFFQEKIIKLCKLLILKFGNQFINLLTFYSLEINLKKIFP